MAEQKHIVVGVPDRSARHVVDTAAWYAQAHGADLTCVVVDATQYTIGASPLGSLYALAPGIDITEGSVFPEDLTAMIDEVATARGVTWHPHAAAGGAAVTLSAVAEDQDALMIVVGTREGMRGSLREFFNGSVAVQLAHRQHRPLVVVPIDPVGPGEPIVRDGVDDHLGEEAAVGQADAAEASHDEADVTPGLEHASRREGGR